MIKKRIFVFLLATICLCTTCCYSTKTIAIANLPFEGIIVDQKVSVFSSPNQNGKHFTTLTKDTPITVTSTKTNGNELWYRILFNTDQNGYVLSRSVRERILVTTYSNKQLGLDKLKLGTDQIIRELGVSLTNSKITDGFATVIYKGVGTYSGEIKEGERSGSGNFVWDDGTYYSGQWSKNIISGEGSLVFPDDIEYSGRFHKGKLFNGIIKTKQPDGAMLVCNVKRGVIQPNYILSLPNGIIIEGITKDHQFVGNVKITYANGDKYEGRLALGLKSGKGTYVWHNGAKYIGYWEEDMMNGNGTYYFTSNTKNNYLKGKFKDNDPVSPITYVSEKGISYKTTWKYGKCINITTQKRK